MITSRIDYGAIGDRKSHSVRYRRDFVKITTRIFAVAWERCMGGECGQAIEGADHLVFMGGFDGAMQSMSSRKQELEKIFYAEIPNVRRMSTMWRGFFDFFYEASMLVNKKARILNVACEHDVSAKRETVYKNHFFNEGEYLTVQYWEGKFEREDDVACDNKDDLYHIPYPSNHFDVLVTTKIVLEHVAEPELVLREFERVLKPGGEAFLVAPLVRRQHQAPHDYFRFTEYGLKYLFDKIGFETVYIKNSNGYVETATQYAYFFQRGLNIPKWLERSFDFFHKWVVESIGFALEKLDNSYGRDFTLYFYARVKKPERS